MTSKTCSSCGNLCEPNHKYCDRCGKLLVVPGNIVHNWVSLTTVVSTSDSDPCVTLCELCLQENPPESHYCAKCGKNLLTS